MAVALVVSCQTVELTIDAAGTNARPFADAGTGGTYIVGTTVTLDGSGSFDPDGSVRAYVWRVIERPSASSATVADAAASTTTITLDAAGEYLVEITVTDDHSETDASRVVLHAVGPMMIVNAGADQSTLWHSTVSLTGSVTIEAGFTYDVEWSFIARPAGSNATLSTTSSLDTSFEPDREGDYTLRLTASTGFNMAFDDVTVSASIPRQMLQYLLVDAEYSAALDRFVLVSDAPPRLRLHNPAANTEQVVTLPEAPVSLSLSPDGLRAAVAHPNKVSIVDLQTMAVTATHNVPVTLGQIVLDGSSRVHLFHAAYPNTFPVYTLDVTNGTSTQATGPQVFAYYSPRLHPSGTKLYVADATLSPADIERWDVSGSAASYVNDSPYHGEYPMGGDLWFTQDGNSIITRLGHVFYASNNPAIDMTHRGSIGLADHNWVTHSLQLGVLAALETEYDQFSNPYRFFLRIYNEQQLTQVRSEELPDTTYNNMTYKSAGRFAAYNATSTKLYVIARLGATPGVAHVIYAYDP